MKSRESLFQVGHVLVARLALTISVVAAALAIGGGLIFAHGGAEVQVEPDQARPGDTITLTGSGFEARTPIIVSLESAAGVTQLGTTTTDDQGMFTLKTAVPGAAAAGSYTIKAVGGDENLTTDFTVTAPAGGTVGGITSPVTNVARQRTTADDVVIGVIFGGLALIGLILVATSRRPRTPVQQTAPVAGMPVQEPLQPSSQRAS